MPRCAKHYVSVLTSRALQYRAEIFDRTAALPAHCHLHGITVGFRDLCIASFVQVYTPQMEPEIWRMAKAHFRCVDAGWHQLISHW